MDKVLEHEPQIFTCANAMKNLINDRQFWIDVEQLRNIIGPVKRAVKNVEFRTTSLADKTIDLKKNEDHIKNLALKLHSISPHNAACERTFSILGWYFGKRRTRLTIEHLEIMAQMHSFLIGNAKSELNYVDPNLREEDFLSIFNEIANSIKDGTDLFSEEDSFLFQESQKIQWMKSWKSFQKNQMI
ncbi:hypothetical protein C2G38_2035034 [Gigaspora rosea]|uniref:HAT C-terminal dimerisation domain-containing protein n=1 Tax=Gigaspora rosea TaxID=44941 RepID=A0A397VDY9_9GLOM|nr:hypothetical protein C2G38_2035034 [Gigaspora rosea]